MSLQVRYIDVPEGAQETARVEGSTGQPFSNPEQIISGGEDIAWATLEPEGWPLDGSRRLLADEPRDLGWWSENRSGEDGRFADPPSFSFLFPEAYTATGLTFIFWPSMKHWCSEIKVSWYNGQTLLDQTAAAPDSAYWTLARTVEGFDRVDVQLLATNQPGQFAKIQQVQIGQVILFSHEELVKVSLLNEMDPSLCELCADTMKIQVRDRKNRTLAPQKNQKLELYRDGQQIAAQYVTSASREARQYYTFSCQSVIGLLEDDYLGGIYTQEPLGSLLQDVLGACAFQLEEAFKAVTVTGYLPVGTRRQALQQIAFATGAVVTTQPDGVIRLSRLSETVRGVFTGGKIFAGARVSTVPKTARTEVYAHSYTQVEEEEILLEKEEVNGEGILFIFSQPHHSYTLTGGSISGSGANWVRLTANGPVTLTGKKYVHNAVVHTRYDATATAAERNNTVTVEAATLVHSGNVHSVLDRLYNAQKLKNVLVQDVVVSTQTAGQKVSSVNPWGTNTEGFITSMDSTFTRSAHTASVTIRGVEVVLKGVCHYAGQLSSGDMEVIY